MAWKLISITLTPDMKDEISSSEEEFDFLIEAIIVVTAQTSKTWIDFNLKSLLNNGMNYCGTTQFTLKEE
jgi:hypothetical protein